MDRFESAPQNAGRQRARRRQVGGQGTPSWKVDLVTRVARLTHVGLAVIARRISRPVRLSIAMFAGGFLLVLVYSGLGIETFVEHRLQLPNMVDDVVLLLVTSTIILILSSRSEGARDRFRLFAEQNRDVVFRYAGPPRPHFEYVSPSIEGLLGIPPADFYEDPDIHLRVVHPDDRGRLMTPHGGDPELVHFVHRDGTVIIGEVRSVAVRDGQGRVVAVEGSVRDVTRRETAIASLRASESRFVTMLDGVDLLAVMLDGAGRVTYANPALLKRVGWRRRRLLGRSWFETCVPDDERAATETLFRDGLARKDLPARSTSAIVDRTGQRRQVSWSNSLIRDADNTIVGTASIGEDVTEREAADRDRQRLAAAVEQSGGTVMITDPGAVILYVNPAFERTTGYAASEAIGRRPFDFLDSGVHPTSYWMDMIRTIQAGRQWSGEWVNRRHDGTHYREQVMISPLRDEDGMISNFVVVGRDVTHEREVEASLEQEIRERAAVVASLQRLTPRPTVEETADAICAEIVGLEGVDVAAIVAFQGASEGVILAVAGRVDMPFARGFALPPARARYLIERAQQGPWAEEWSPGDEYGSYGDQLTEIGIRATAYAPLRSDGRLLGVILLAVMRAEEAAHLVQRLPIVIEFGATASALLARGLTGRLDQTRLRAEIERILVDRAFQSAFQPIVDARNGSVLGYEALTRFADGSRPDARFADAWSVGLGPELELATLSAAIAAAADLPEGTWLDVNVSPGLVLQTDRLREVTSGSARPLVIEITEHERVADYRALREHFSALGGDVQLAIDDAGAGEANFHHIVELRPDMVKIDIGLVRGVDADLGRQALVVALRHFAQETGCRLVGEGVETAAEGETLARLGVDLLQGYHHGRPMPIDQVRATARVVQTPGAISSTVGK